MKCPQCAKRVFDVSKVPREPIIIELKCAQCGRVVRVPFGRASEQKAEQPE